jgi:hypothetical protein
MNLEIILPVVSVCLAGPFAVASVLMVLFTTKFLQHLFLVLRFLGFKKHDNAYWQYYDPTLDYTGNMGQLTRGDLNEWLSTSRFGLEFPLLAEGLACPGCVAVQSSLWLGVLASVSTGSPWLWVVALLCWPSAGRIIFKQI